MQMQVRVHGESINDSCMCSENHRGEETVVADLILILILIVVCVAAVVYVHKKKKSGNCACGGCGGCPHADACNKSSCEGEQTEK